MCGIVGYIGSKKSSQILVDGLSKLEYRGYDSAGIAVIEDNNLLIEKFKGRLANLENNIKNKKINSTVGIGHTRWATHGEPSDINSHPHYNKEKTIAVVHNGIIENYAELRKNLIAKGYEFISETDTEVIPNLISYYYNGDIEEAVRKAVKKLRGSYALGVLCVNEPDKIIAVKKDNPLILGVGENENFIASDIPAIFKYTKNILILDDGEMAVVTKDAIKLKTIEGKEVNRETFKVNWDIESAEKNGYDHFMLKEMFEQPKAVRDTLRGRLVDSSNDIFLDNINLTKEDIDSITKIYIVACGTAYHAGLIGKTIFEQNLQIPVEVDIASEFRYRKPLIDKSSLLIIISQSGETADTLAALRLGKQKGAKVLGITNVVGSAVSRESDYVLYTWAGPEIAVASTKAYTTQLVSLYLTGLYMGKVSGKMNSLQIEKIKNSLLDLPLKIENILKHTDEYRDMAFKFKDNKDIYYLGRGLDAPVALEGALKMKEVSYIHAEAYAAGELKHGPIALIDKDVPVISLATQSELFEKMVSNIKEVKTRGAKIFTISMEGNTEIESFSDGVIYIPETIDMLAPILSVIPLQFLSYYSAIFRGCDVDKPKNLAKSVTVE